MARLPHAKVGHLYHATGVLPIKLAQYQRTQNYLFYINVNTTATMLNIYFIIVVTEQGFT
jgi:hypothetical protein